MSDSNSDDPNDVSGSQISRFADFLRGKKTKTLEETQSKAPKPKTLEEMSVLSLMTLPGRKWSKSKEPQNDFHVHASGWRRPESATKESSNTLAILAVVVALVFVGGGAWFILNSHSDSTQQTEATEDDMSLEELLKN